MTRRGGCWVNRFLVGCFGFNGPLRQYFSLYQAVSQSWREKSKKDRWEKKMSKQPPAAPTTSAIGPCPTFQFSRHWKVYPAPSLHPTTPMNRFYMITSYPWLIVVHKHTSYSVSVKDFLPINESQQQTYKSRLNIEMKQDENLVIRTAWKRLSRSCPTVEPRSTR